MAIIDYGAILLKDGVVVNTQDGLFMEKSDSGDIIGTVKYRSGEECDVERNFFVIAGDKHFCLAFYKNQMMVISDGLVFDHIYSSPFISQEFHYKNLPSIKLEYLDKSLREKQYIDCYTHDELLDEKRYYQHRYGIKKGLRLYYRWIKRSSRKVLYKYRSKRYIATWNYNGHEYMIIFGYGIDNNYDVWNQIKDDDSWDFSDIEKEILEKILSQRE